MARTTKRDLRSGLPLWLGNRKRPIAAPTLAANVEADVAIVGGGISGALVADALLSAGLSIVAVDRRGFAKGSTAASTALLQFEIDQPLTQLSKSIGKAKAARAYWRSAAAVDHIRGRIIDLGLKCQFRERQTVYLPGNILDPAALADEATERLKAGLRSRFAGPDETKALTLIEAPCSIVSAGCAEVDPVKLTAGLWASVAARGGRLFAPAEIVELDDSASGVKLTTADGASISAKHAVFATGYELMSFVPARSHAIKSTWAFATAPQKTLWPSRALIWEAAEPYLYMRTTQDNRIVVGGEDEDFVDEDKRQQLTAAKVKAIAKKLSAYLPEASVEPEFVWSGCFGESSNGLPTIGVIPGMRRSFAVLGYGGNGITFSAVAAQLIQRKIVGLPDPDADLFAFGA